MGVLSQYIERPVKDGGAGIATVQVSLIWPVTEKIQPPRALWVPFPFGRPLGPPNRPDVQLDVLRRTLGLVGQPAGPALVEYPDDIEGDFALEEVWSCPVTFPAAEPKTELESLTAQLRTEAELLMPWYDQGLRARGRSTVGTSGKDAGSVTEMLVLMASGLSDEEIDSRLVLIPGTTADMALDVVRERADNRELLKVQSADDAGFPTGRFSRTIVPTTMQDRRGERARPAAAP